MLPSWFYAATGPGNSYVAQGGTSIAELRGGFRLNRNLPASTGGVFVNMGLCSEGGSSYYCWIDAREANLIVRAQITGVPPTAPVKPLAVVTLGADLGVHPTGAELEWDYGDNTPREKKGTALGTTHAYADTGSFKVKVRLYHPRTKQLVAIDSFAVEVRGCADTFVDPRDGYRYRQVCIGTQTWMGENLQFNAPGSRCYNDDPAHCITYGRMYTWFSTMNGAVASTTNPSGVRGVCPANWHVPSQAEWEQLGNRYGGTLVGARALKSTTRWNLPNDATNESGFSALPGGFFGVDATIFFLGLGANTYIWSTSEWPTMPVERAVPISMNNAGAWYVFNPLTKPSGAYVRCVKN